MTMAAIPPMPRRPNWNPAAAVCRHGTAADYLRFCRMLLGGGALDGTRLLSPKTVSRMTMNHLPGGARNDAR